MHQHPRTPPVTASPARSPQTNPMRSNNPRDHSRDSSASTPEKLVPTRPAVVASDNRSAAMKTQEPVDKDNLAKLNQVVQVGLPSASIQY